MFVAGCYSVKSVVRILLTKLLFEIFTCHISTLGEKPSKIPCSVVDCDWCAVVCKFHAMILNATIILSCKRRNEMKLMENDESIMHIN